VYGGVLMGIHRFDIERGIQIVTAILRLVLIVTFLNEEWGLLTIASIFLALTVIENLCQMVFAYYHVKTLSLRLTNFNSEFLKDSSRFSAYAFLSSISNQLIDCTDSIVIGIFLSPKAIVPFYIALRLSRMISTPIEYIGRIAMPKAGDLFARGEQSKLEHLITKGVGMAFLLSTAFFIGGGFFGKSVITTWIGPGYEQSHLLFLVLLVTRIVAIPSGVMRCVMFGMGQVKAPSIIYFCEAIANVLLSMLLIGPFGLMGVALGTAIPLILIESAVLLPLAFRVTQVSFSQIIRHAIGPQLPALIALLVYSFVITEVVPQAIGWFYIYAVSAGGGTVLVLTWLASNRMIKHFDFHDQSGHELKPQSL
jgi:O-antigen/teichoic acid export membrane protein